MIIFDIIDNNGKISKVTALSIGLNTNITTTVPISVNIFIIIDAAAEFNPSPTKSISFVKRLIKSPWAFESWNLTSIRRTRWNISLRIVSTVR